MEEEDIRTKKALLVGCNYENTGIPELKGSHNDVQRMRAILINNFGFKPSHIEVMIDGPHSTTRPTGSAIKRSLNRMADEALYGDFLFFHFSGHGTRFPRPGKSRLLEAIVPCDANLITSADLRSVVGRFTEGVTLTIMCDSCNSGGLIDRSLEQIGPGRGGVASGGESPRFVAYEVLVQQQLSPATGLKDWDIGVHLTKLFESAASLVFRSGDGEYPAPAGWEEVVLLVDELSTDNQSGYGEFSNAVVLTVQNWEKSGTTTATANEGMSNRRVMQRVRNFLQMKGVPKQHPCLYCTNQNADVDFLDAAEFP